jgi:hypothetical protein
MKNITTKFDNFLNKSKLNESVEESAYDAMHDGIKDNDIERFKWGYNQLVTKTGKVQIKIGVYGNGFTEEDIKRYTDWWEDLVHEAANKKNLEIIKLLFDVFDKDNNLKISNIKDNEKLIHSSPWNKK